MHVLVKNKTIFRNRRYKNLRQKHNNDLKYVFVKTACKNKTYVKYQSSV